MPVDIFINLAQDYADLGYDHQFLKDIFSVNHEVKLSDFPGRHRAVTYDFQPQDLAMVAEPTVPYGTKE